MTTTARATPATTFSLTPDSDTRFTIDEPLLDRARALAPIIREHAPSAEYERQLASPVVNAMRNAGLFRLFTPRARGGLQVDPVTFARVVEELASYDSAAGWAMQAGNTGAWFASRFPAAGADEFFADGPDLLMAASFSPPHRAVAVPGGYRFTGRGPLASTVHHCPWVLMTAIVFDGDQPRMTPFGPAMVEVVMRTSEVEIVDTWQSLGLRGSDSQDVVANDVFVPESRTDPLIPDAPPSPGFEGPLYRMPALSAVYVVVAPVALAIARGAITALRELTDRKTPMGSMKTIRHRAAVQSAFADAEAQLRSARLLFYDALATAWMRAVAGDAATLEQKADLMLAAANGVRVGSRVTDLMHRMGGSSGVYARSPLERHFRDAQTVRHHGLMCESRFETVGQVYLGVEPEFAMVAF